MSPRAPYRAASASLRRLPPEAEQGPAPPFGTWIDSLPVAAAGQGVGSAWLPGRRARTLPPTTSQGDPAMPARRLVAILPLCLTTPCAGPRARPATGRLPHLFKT